MEEQMNMNAAAPQSAAKPGKTVGVLAVVFGVIAILIGFIPLLGIIIALPFAIAGLVLGIIAMVKDAKAKLSWFGLILPILSFVVMFVIAPVIALNAVNRAFEEGMENPELQEAFVEFGEALENADINIDINTGNFEGFDEAAATFDGVAPEDLAEAVHAQQAQTAADTQAAIEAARAEAMANQ